MEFPLYESLGNVAQHTFGRILAQVGARVGEICHSDLDSDDLLYPDPSHPLLHEVFMEEYRAIFGNVENNALTAISIPRQQVSIILRFLRRMAEEFIIKNSTPIRCYNSPIVSPETILTIDGLKDSVAEVGANFMSMRESLFELIKIDSSIIDFSETIADIRARLAHTKGLMERVDLMCTHFDTRNPYDRANSLDSPEGVTDEHEPSFLEDSLGDFFDPWLRAWREEFFDMQLEPHEHELVLKNNPPKWSELLKLRALERKLWLYFGILNAIIEENLGDNWTQDELERSKSELLLEIRYLSGTILLI